MGKITLRPYQVEAVDSVYEHLRTRTDNPAIVLPTAAGKTPVLATICNDAAGRWNGRVAVVSHVKELLQQARDKLSAICPGIPVGIYSAGLKSRDKHEPIIVAGIQSVFRRACEFDPFDLIIVDEAHLIPPDGDGMYQQFVRDAAVVNPNVRVVGLTATPYRMRTGPVCGPDNILNHVAYDVGVRELIAQGYLSRLTTRRGRTRPDVDSVATRGGEFVAGDLERAVDTDEAVDGAVDEIVEVMADRKSCLIFAAGVQHAEHVADVLREKSGEPVGVVTGSTPGPERDRLLAEFKAGSLRYIVNVNVLTIGFDAPNIDVVAMMRNTMSPGLYYQMVGRGFRLSPDTGKTDCLVLDFADNIMRHGPVDLLDGSGQCAAAGSGDAPAKTCPNCQAVIALSYRVCPQCGDEFPVEEKPKHNRRASNGAIVSDDVEPTEYAVSKVEAFIHTKRNADDNAPKTCRVEYTIGYHREIREWICFEHEGFARGKAERWWKDRSWAPVPATAAEAVDLINNYDAIAVCKSITVIPDGDYDRIIGWDLGPRPEWAESEDGSDRRLAELPAAESLGIPEDEIPF